MALVGNLSEIDVNHLIDLALQTPGYANLLVNSEGLRYRLYTNDGQVVHAEEGSRSGSKVVYDLLACTAGTFELEKGGKPPPRVTIEIPWNTLLLEALQYIDEQSVSQSNSQINLEANTMAGKERLEEVLKEMANDMEPGLQGIAVAGTDGMGIAFHKIAGEAAESLGSQMALIMQLSRRSAERLKEGDVEDVLLTTDKSYMIGRFLSDNHYFAVVNVDRDSVLGNVRLTMRNYADRLAKAIPAAK